MPPLLIGERPRAPGDEPLLGNPGRRLASILGLTLSEYADSYERVFLVRDPFGPWPSESAARAAEALLAKRMIGHRAILFGTRVARAFHVDDLPMFDWFEIHGALVAKFPHPSGTSRWWNDERRRSIASRWLREASRLG